MEAYGTPLNQSIGEDLSRRILGGEFDPGARLPTIRQLADEYETSYFTVQTALKTLADQGLVEQRRRTGTVVRRDLNVLTCVGMYVASAMVGAWQYAFNRELCRQLELQLAEQGVRVCFFTDTRPNREQEHPLPELVSAIADRRIQAILVPYGNSFSIKGLAPLEVPFSYIGDCPLSPNRVGFDTSQMVRIAVARLAEQGCRTVGMISAIPLSGEHIQALRPFYDTFVASASDLGMKIRDDWMFVPPGGGLTSHEAFGYASFHALWRRKSRPDGLLVYTDIVARGVMTAALELGVSVPDELKLVFHHNTGVNWVCPLAVDWVESDVARWATEMIRQVRRQASGERVEPVLMDFEMKAHCGCEAGG